MVFFIKVVGIHGAHPGQEQIGLMVCDHVSLSLSLSLCPSLFLLPSLLPSLHVCLSIYPSLSLSLSLSRGNAERNRQASRKSPPLWEADPRPCQYSPILGCCFFGLSHDMTARNLFGFTLVHTIVSSEDAELGEAGNHAASIRRHKAHLHAAHFHMR